MNRKMITQEYYVLATDENGNMSVMYREESKAGIVVAGVMDLLINDIITLEKKKITVTKDLPSEFGHIASLYAYLKEKPRSTDKLMGDYLMSTGSRIKQLTAEIGQSLLEDNVATKENGGLFGNKTIYVSDMCYKDQLVGIINSVVASEDEMSPHDMALIYILKETKNLNQYFSQYEKDELKAKLKELKKNPRNKQLADMINYVNDITVVALACMMTMPN